MFSFLKRRNTFDTRWPTLGAAVGSPSTLPTLEHTELSLNHSSFEPSLVESILQEVGVPCNVLSVEPGPTTTTYKLFPQFGVRIELIKYRLDDIGIRLGVDAINYSKGKLTIPNSKRTLVNFSDCTAQLIRDTVYKNPTVPYIIGVDEHGVVRTGDLTTSPHTLIAGSTGSGKSNQVNAILASILATRHPTHVRLIMIDPKRVEYSQYKGLPHLLHPVVDEVEWAVHVLSGLCQTMEERYKFLSKQNYQSVEQWNAAKCPNLSDVSIEQLNQRIYPIIVFIDEYADLVMQNKKAAMYVTRLSQKARAAGIHLVLCTQVPKANVISTNITTNFPTQIAFQVKTRSMSGVILDDGGAENLLRQGDMIFQNASEKFRAQGPFLSQEVTSRLVQHWK